FAKIAMAIWCQVSGVRCRETCSVVMGHSRGNDSFFTPYTAVSLANCQRRSRSGTFRSNVLFNLFNIQIFIDLKILHIHKISIGHPVSPFILSPDT
ncbi:MAG: hypothetical protein PVH55_07875, partial [Desulfobacterales bacterium]